MDVRITKFDLTCTKCGKDFVIFSAVGPSNICDDCTLPMLEAVWGCKLVRNKTFGVVEPVQ